MSANLCVLSPHDGQQRRLEGARITIGKLKNMDIRLNGEQVSGSHCTINRGSLLDKKSTNGTLLNGDVVQKGTKYPLKEGDEIKVGDHTLKIQVFNADATASSSSASSSSKSRAAAAASASDSLSPLSSSSSAANTPASSTHQSEPTSSSCPSSNGIEANPISSSISARDAAAAVAVTDHAFIVAQGRPYELTDATHLKIGRNSSNHIVFNTQEVSGSHCVIKGKRITDLGSTNGTTVNNKALVAKVPTLLVPGDVVSLGDDHKLHVVTKENLQATMTAVSAAPQQSQPSNLSAFERSSSSSNGSSSSSSMRAPKSTSMNFKKKLADMKEKADNLEFNILYVENQETMRLARELEKVEQRQTALCAGERAVANLHDIKAALAAMESRFAQQTKLFQLELKANHNQQQEQLRADLAALYNAKERALKREITSLRESVASRVAVEGKSVGQSALQTQMTAMVQQLTAESKRSAGLTSQIQVLRVLCVAAVLFVLATLLTSPPSGVALKYI
jgi:pSer/pThr/pTyr-binding forkhead associated (FHA) protein